MRAFVLALLAVPLLPACQTSESRDYHITGRKRFDAEGVTHALATVAPQTGFRRGDALRYDSPALVIFRAPDLDLRAFREPTEIRVTLWRGSWSARRAFSQTDRLLTAQLRSEFGRRLVIDPLDHSGVTITVY